MKILIDPTGKGSTILAADGKKKEVFSHAERDAGAGLSSALRKLKIKKDDEIRVISGPGNFAAVRTACLVANAAASIFGCQLSARSVDETEFKSVGTVEPTYAAPPSITPPKK